METAIDFVRAQPTELLLGAAGLLCLIAVVLIAASIARLRFVRKVRDFLAAPGDPNAADHFPTAELLRRSRLIERMARREGNHVIRRLGLDLLWSERLAARRRSADFRRVLTHATERGLFTCFVAALGNRRLEREFRVHLVSHDELLALRRIALGARGDCFAGAEARAFFADRIDDIRQMTGDPEWPSRHFAVTILLHDRDERSLRALWDAFADPHPLVRRTVAAGLATDERQRLYERLTDLVLHDPVYEVRLAARRRVVSDLFDLYSLRVEHLEPEEALHVAELLDAKNKDDESAAVRLLSGDDLELRLAAGRFLDRAGTLERRLLAADFGDRDELDRTRTLLRHAVEVNVTGFLSAVRKDPGPAALTLAAELLSLHGPVELIVELAERVFRHPDEGTKEYPEVYEAVVRCISDRGPEAAHLLMAREIGRRRANTGILARVLAAIPEGRDHIYREPLLAAFHDPSFPERPLLRRAIGRLDQAIVLDEMLTTIAAGRERYPHQVRADSLWVLGELRLPYALQQVLEHLPTLPTESARDFARLLQEHHPRELEHKVRLLIDGVDATVRAAIIAALPATGKRTFLADIRRALHDASPEVRVAAVWALVDYDETRTLGQAADLLRDPVPWVRDHAARALGSGGGVAAVDALVAAIRDENEVAAVKRAAVSGLGSSRHAQAVDALVPLLDTEGLRAEAQAALAAKRDGASLARLVEQFKDADPAMRTLIAQVFTMMGESGEETIGRLLAEGTPSLKPYLAEILEMTGYVESRIRMLNHRNPKVRREAAGLLAKIASKASYRGVILAARDPDPEVRVHVVKALERLDDEDGGEILRSLEQDPDRRVRTYTHWAMERVRAKKL